jgi:hypothetical protein
VLGWCIMSWRFPRWDSDLTNHSSRTEVPEAGGWLYQVRDPNGAFSTVFVPNVTEWAVAIGYATAKAAQELVPVAVVPDPSRIRHAKQPKPGPRA